MDNNFLPRGLKGEFGWYKGRHLPHFDAGERTQFVTIRLADSLPRELLDEWRIEAKTDAGFRKKIEKYLDNSYGACWLKREDVAEMVQNALKFHDGKKYLLFAWVVMLNHLHFLIRPLPGQHLDSIMHSIKSYTAHEANKLLSRSGNFWQEESFDRYIRDTRHFRATFRYIHMNPVKAGLCSSPEDWKYSTRFAVDWSGGRPAHMSTAFAKKRLV